nr:PREDICTED: protein TBATA isoform X1 [Latimeria chalumnae]|eukprot:XP_014354286.1 PREDICTED: protein TBATA isoform X1 [Latimeria chalumnae]
MTICHVNDEAFFPKMRFKISKPSTAEREFMFRHWLPANAIGINSTRYPINPITGLQHFPCEETTMPRINSYLEPWREELRDFTNKVTDFLPQNNLEKTEDEPPKRSTQYSTETGRLIPPPSRPVSSRQALRNEVKPNTIDAVPRPDHEILVLQMLCQILETDSIFKVQKWLLTAGQKEKDLILYMIRSVIMEEMPPCQQSAAGDKLGYDRSVKKLHGSTVQQAWENEKTYSSFILARPPSVKLESNKKNEEGNKTSSNLFPILLAEILGNVEAQKKRDISSAPRSRIDSNPPSRCRSAVDTKGREARLLYRKTPVPEKGHTNCSPPSEKRPK